MKAQRLTDICWLLMCMAWLYVVAIALPTVAGEPNSPTVQKSQRGASIRYVQVEETEVYAGPSDEYYPTAIIARGQAIEVYDHTADGWLAIRPPQGSFSWLPAAQGLLLPGGRVVEVTEKNAVAWIGSSLGTAKQYRWQVKLERGEQLAVLGEQNIQDPATQAKALWYKVAPPNGEFRWIRENATSDTPPGKVEVARNRQESAGDADRTSDTESAVVQASAEEPLAAQPVSVMNTNQSQRASKSHKHAKDPWESWHAVEFKNGSFSFPGIARMFGMEPVKPYSGVRRSDPFDLNAAYTQSRAVGVPLTADNASSELTGSESLAATGQPIAGQPLAGRQSRGWRDPRQLRQSRLQDTAETNELPYEPESVLASNAAENNLDAEVMEASLTTDQAIGTSVVPAANHSEAGEPVQSAAVQSATVQSAGWYGVSQAPDAARKTASSSKNDLKQLQWDLSEMVAGPEHTWDLAPLARRAREFVEHGSTAIERGEARLLLERIESFAQVSQQSSQLGMSPPPASVPVQLPASGAVQPAVATRPVAPGDNNQFDATGWLVPVHSNGRDMPTHALTNDAGKIIVYLTGAPGINLTRFESQPVGVYGLRGYLPQLKANHLQVERTVRLK